jgi:glucokinase
MSQTRQFISLHDAQPPFYGGIDVGGTSIKIGIVDELGRPMAWLSMPTSVELGPENGVARMVDGLGRAAQKAGLTIAQLAAIGLGTPGTMDIPKGMLLEPPNLPGWWHFPICQRLQELTGKQVGFANDAGAAAYGEFWTGSGRVFHSMVMFTLGTGVGGGIIIGDLSLEGENSAGAELGHIIIDSHDDALICNCGLPGHLEAYASATAVVRRTEAALNEGRKSSVSARLAQGADLTTLLLAEEAEKGDELALDIIMDTARYLGIGAVTVMHTIDPNGVVIGGAMTFGGHSTELGRRFLERVRQEVRSRTFPFLAERTVVDYASLGADAGYIGAAGVARLAHRASLREGGH